MREAIPCYEFHSGLDLGSLTEDEGSASEAESSISTYRTPRQNSGGIGRRIGDVKASLATYAGVYFKRFI